MLPFLHGGTLGYKGATLGKLFLPLGIFAMHMMGLQRAGLGPGLWSTKWGKWWAGFWGVLGLKKSAHTFS